MYFAFVALCLIFVRVFIEILRKHKNANIVFWRLGGNDKNLFPKPLFYDFTFTLTSSIPLPLFFLYSADLIFLWFIL